MNSLLSRANGVGPPGITWGLPGRPALQSHNALLYFWISVFQQSVFGKLCSWNVAWLLLGQHAVLSSSQAADWDLMLTKRVTCHGGIPGLLEGQQNQPKPHADLFSEVIVSNTYDPLASLTKTPDKDSRCHHRCAGTQAG